MGSLSGSFTITAAYADAFTYLNSQDTDYRVGEGRAGYATDPCLLILKTGTLSSFEGRVVSATMTLTVTQNPDFDTAVQRLTADYGNNLDDTDTYTALEALYDDTLSPPDIGSGTGSIEVDISDAVQAAIDAGDSRVLLVIEESPFDYTPAQGTIIITAATYTIVTVADATAATAEPTGSFTFQDLLIRFATEIGTAYHGTDGDEAAQVPTDAHDLAEAKRHVNDAIRQVLNDAPPQGWRWARPKASVVLWPSVELDDDVTANGGTYDSTNDQTTLEASEASFYPSMERKTVTITDVGDFIIKAYASSTRVTVEGDASSVTAATFSIEADGDYSLPKTFGGVWVGQIKYAADSGAVNVIKWADEGSVRTMRETSAETGEPNLAGTRVMSDRRQWWLSVWPTPSEAVTVEFPYELYFNTLTDVTDKPPIPFLYDELLRAAVLMIAERDVHRLLDGPHTRYYQQALAAAYLTDARSAPKRLGYCGDPGAAVQPNVYNFRGFRSRPTVEFNE